MRLDSAGPGGDNRCHMSRVTERRLLSLRPVVAALVLTICAVPASSQDAQATLGIRTLIGAGQPRAAARLVVTSEDRTRAEITLEQAPGQTASVLALPPGAYRVRAALSGYQPAEATFEAHAGARQDLVVTFAPLGTGASTVSTADAPTRHRVTFAPDRLDILPSARTVWSLLDVAHPFLITDRIDNGGLGGAVPARVGGYLSPWTQTSFRLGTIDVTDPTSGGTPLFYPGLDALTEVVVSSAGVGVESAGPGPTVTLVPRRAADAWGGSVRGSLTPNGLQGGRSGPPSPIAQLEHWVDTNAAVGGPLGASRGSSLFVSALGTRARWTERDAPGVLASNVRSVMAHAVRTAGSGGEVTATVAVTDDTRPYRARARFAAPNLQESNLSVGAGVGWRRAGVAGAWSFDGAYQGWSADPDDRLASAPGGAIERLQDGPPNGLFEAGRESGRKVEASASFAARPRGTWARSHELGAGVTVAHARADWVGGVQPAFAEFVDGAPARVWDVHGAGTASRRSAASAGVFVSDRIALSQRLTLRTGARLEFDSGSARDSNERIRWTTPLPRVSASWRPRSGGQLVLTTGYGWYGHRLRLDTLAVGDPAGASGVMSRWDDRNGDRLPTSSELTAVAAVGSCCAGANPGRVDPGLQRPTTREFVIGFEHAVGAWQWGINGVDRRESNGLVLANVGLTSADYTTRLVGDPGIDLNAPVTAPTLAIRSRNPSSFLRDSYLLANADGPAGRYQGAEIFVRRQAGAWRVDFGGTTYRAEAPGANRGHRSDENDQGTLGELQLDPNATLNARGRLFFDRAYVIKLSGDYRAPGDVNVGVASRYQDGQPFARVVVADGLGQGADIVPAYPRGGQRFTYTLTLDARVRKGFQFGARRLDVIVEAFNVLDLAHEVEEYIVTGARFRTVTAVQPPREVRIGLRLGF